MNNIRSRNSAERTDRGRPVDVILPRLDKVKASGNGNWKACCPAHQDRDPSLSIRELGHGQVLIHCFAGCSAEDVMAAIGLTTADLYPGPKRTRIGPSYAAKVHEWAIVEAGKAAIAKGETLSEKDRNRFELAKQRLELIG